MEEVPKKIIFLDTNIFIQCRELKDLPWEEISGGEDLLLLVPRAVQKEIERQKSEGSTRRGKRARKATSFFRDIILTDETKLILRDSNPCVGISLPEPVSTNYPSPERLDLSLADDQIVCEMLAYQATHPNTTVILLTHDTNLMLTCKRCKLDFQVVPDTWFLQPEPDANDKRIKSLEQKIKGLEQSGPVVELLIHDGKD